MPESESSPKTSRWVKAHRGAVQASRANPAVGFGSSFALAMALFAWGGYRLDVKTGQLPVFTLTGVFLGLVYGAYEVWKCLEDF